MSTYTFFQKVNGQSFEVLMGVDPALKRNFMVIYTGPDEQLVYSNLDDEYLDKHPESYQHVSYFVEKAKSFSINVPQHLIDHLDVNRVVECTLANALMIQSYITLLDILESSECLSGEVFPTRRCNRILDALRYGQKCSYSDVAGFLDDWVYTGTDNDPNVLTDCEVNFGISTSMMEKIMGESLQGLLEPSEQSVFDKAVKDLHFGNEVTSESIAFILGSIISKNEINFNHI